MSENILEPTPLQIRNCKSMGWDYLGDGLFEHSQAGLIGYFTASGFVKES